MAGNLKLLWATQKTHLKSAFLSKSDAFINVLMMIVNNCSFAFMWWVLFTDRGQINGWTFDDMLIVFTVTCNGLWIFASFFRGIDDITRFVENGTMDNFLSTPRSPLFMLSISKSVFANWGDMITGYLAFFLSCYVSFGNFFLVTLFSIYAFMLIYGFLLTASSLALFASNTDRVYHSLAMSLFIFMHQPASIFTGWYKVLFLSIIPAGYMTIFPVNLIKEFNWLDFLYMNIGCLGFFFFSIWLFNKGLKNYSSGNRFGVR